ncbi:MAG: LON peptidase substrate-binding domain-containing protein [Alphaproteobacteria bacterium]|nr:LON peptidase substrate-binding domain-containing protein [Alphaproteobacteria bacterium]MBL6776149.1 LON peptidase substrate-binding domain-containing protein [Alphaproteobacteria bacterium]
MATTRGPFEPEFSELPRQLPIFPLPSALLLPGGKLPLNIFEPRYLAMVRDCLVQPHRLIGMVQPRADEEDNLYEIGCAGRISSYGESDDGRLLITLSGTLRYRLLDIHEVEDGYKMANVSWIDFKNDLIPDESQIDRALLIENLRHYFELKGYSADWEHIGNCEDEKLVTTLSMICPFDVPEKQALLECPDLNQRVKLLIAILEMASHADDDESTAKH